MTQESPFKLHPTVGHLIQQPSPEQIVAQTKEGLQRQGFPTEDPQELFNSLVAKGMVKPLHDLVLYDPKIRVIVAENGISFKDYDPDKGTGTLILFDKNTYKSTTPACKNPLPIDSL